MAARDEAFSSFAAARYSALVRTAYLLVGDRGHAEDLVQQALMKTYAAWHRIEAPAAEAYTRKTLVRATVRWRSRRWHGEVPTADLPEVAVEIDASRIDEVRAALATLPATQRAVLVLRYFDDLSERETAELLGISVGTVKSRASRGLAALRAKGEVLSG